MTVSDRARPASDPLGRDVRGEGPPRVQPLGPAPWSVGPASGPRGSRLPALPSASRCRDGDRMRTYRGWWTAAVILVAGTAVVVGSTVTSPWLFVAAGVSTG